MLLFYMTDAAAQAAAEPDPLMGFMPLIIIFIVFYFLLIRPQQKKAKEHQEMVGNLAKGDEVITNGGIAGRIMVVHDDFVTVEIADNTQVRIQRTAVTSVLPKGTLKTIE